MNKEKLIDLVLRIHFVNRSPSVNGVFTMSWLHGMEYAPGVTYHKELAELHESLGLPKELPEPEYPEKIWAAFKTFNNGTKATTKISEPEKDIEVFSGSVKEVQNWCQNHDNEYSYMTSTGRTVITEEEAYEKWKAKILEENGLSK